MTYLLKGDPKEVEKVIRENRIRVQRGMIEFIPVEPEEAIGVVDEDVATVDTDNVPTPESVPEIEETAEKEGESVPEIEEMPENPADSVPESDNPELMDDKHIGEPEDLQEVDLETDDKTFVSEDSKEIPAPDVKETAVSKKTARRSKKSE
ncbi:MAG: hypothetical protein JFR41_11040 [Muribaculaceae bacterium]|nr:hypothetical protein [Muribaculaceae bacterium]